MSTDFLFGLLALPILVASVAVAVLLWSLLTRLASKVHVKLVTTVELDHERAAQMAAITSALAHAPRLRLLELFGWDIVFARAYNSRDDAGGPQVRAAAPKMTRVGVGPQADPLPWFIGDFESTTSERS